MKQTHLVVVIAFGLCSPVMAAQRGNMKRNPPAAIVSEQPKNDTPAKEPEPQVRVVRYSNHELVPVNAKLRFTTLIILPKQERILDFICGDKENWVVNGIENMAYIKPAKAGTQTDLHLVTASGNTYSFVLTDISEVRDAVPDLKVFIETDDPAMTAATEAPPKFFSADVIDDYRHQVEIAKDETQRVRKSAQEEIDRGISRFISNMRFPYRYEAGKKPFGVRAMYTDDKFTYIQARPEETPALYEIKDGKPSLVNFEYIDGVYTVSKILDEGYLAIGKQKLRFRREP